ncbi:hypothetical protein ACLMJK_008705 [Lecanora helva]
MGALESRMDSQTQDGSCDDGSDIAIKRETPSQVGSHLGDESASPSSYPQSPTISRSENPNVERLREAIYVRYLFEDFVLSPHKESKVGWLEVILPKLYASSAIDSTLNLAVRAAAYAYMGNKRQARELQIEAREMYGHCLKILTADLTSLEIATSNDTATAVLVLGLYECIAGNGSHSFWHSHGHGLSLLMQLRNSHSSQAQLTLPKEEAPDGMIICQMQRRNLDLRKPPPPEEGTYIGSLDGSCPANRMFGSAFQCSHIVARAHNEILKADGTTSSTARLEKVVAEIRTFDITLVRLFRTCVSLSPTDKYRTDAELQAQWLASCPTYRAMAMWIFLQASRIILHEVHAECLHKLNASDDEISRAIALVRQSTDSIFSAVKFMTEETPKSPYSLECKGPRNIGGYYLLWPLHIIVECKFAEKKQKQIARDVLLRIGSEMGLKHALEIARAVE